MALLHRAELRPTKLDLLAAWLPAQPWCDAPPGTGVERVAAYRFDDPANAVGIETLLVRAGDGVLYQVPLTYRAAPLADGEAWLVGTAEHSVLGRRWVYDGCGDPVYRTALTGAVAGEVPQADEYIEIDGELIMRERSMTVTRSGPAATHDWRESDRDGLCVGIGGGVAGAGGAGGVGGGAGGADFGREGGGVGYVTRIVADSAELIVVRRPGALPALPGDALVGTWSGQPAPLPLAYASPA